MLTKDQLINLRLKVLAALSEERDRLNLEEPTAPEIENLVLLSCSLALKHIDEELAAKKDFLDLSNPEERIDHA